MNGVRLCSPGMVFTVECHPFLALDGTYPIHALHGPNEIFSKLRRNKVPVPNTFHWFYVSLELDLAAVSRFYVSTMGITFTIESLLLKFL